MVAAQNRIPATTVQLLNFILYIYPLSIAHCSSASTIKAVCLASVTDLDTRLLFHWSTYCLINHNLYCMN